jgi:hypothetical protein
MRPRSFDRAATQDERIADSSSPPSASSGSAEPLNAQAESGGGGRKSVVRCRNRIRPDSCRDREMKRVEFPERDGTELDQEISGAQGVPIFQWMHFEKSLGYIVFEGVCGAALGAGIDVVIAPAVGQQTA